jgi:ribosomal protein S18 acetylase RimI-like enzyme
VDGPDGLAPASLEAALPYDAAAVVALRDAAARWQRERGIRQWEVGEVTPEQVRRQIERGEWHVVREPATSSVPAEFPVKLRVEVRAAVRVVTADPDVWGTRDDDAWYVHGLVVDRRQTGRALGARVLRRVEQDAWSRGRTAVRLDCVASNERLRRYYREQGYREVGERSFPGAGSLTVVLLEKDLRGPAGAAAQP